jgi:hypothetical protein
MIKIALVTRPQNSSPRVLAESLALLISELGISSKIFYRINAFKRLLKYKPVSQNYSYHKWLIYKIIFFLGDKHFIRSLKAFDAIIISDCSPTAFLPNTYDIERLREIVGSIPILFYEVYFLGNAPTQLEILVGNNYSTIERFNWHLSVTDVTEIKSKPVPPWSQIGLYLKGTGIKPNIKNQFIAVVDFIRKGYEDYRFEQIQVLEELRIPFISLEKHYSITNIRSIYKQAAVFFIQFPEAFGLPIAECLSFGSYIFTPDSSWPMAWRLDENPSVHGPGSLPECFVVYNGKNDLKTRLNEIKNDYDFKRTPQKVFDIFLKYYPFYYEANQVAFKDVLGRIERKELNY